MPANQYVSGNTIRLTATFVDETTGAKFDPTTVLFQVMEPGGRTVLTPSPVRDATGEWHADQAADKPGWWTWRVSTTGPEAAAESGFQIKHSPFKG